MNEDGYESYYSKDDVERILEGALPWDYMGFDPDSRQQREVLHKVCLNLHRSMEPMRKARKVFVQQFVGHRYSPLTDQRTVYLNIVEMAASLWTRRLVSHNPRVLITSKSRELDPWAADFESGLNHRIEEMDFADVLGRCALDAIFGIGCTKIGRDFVFDGRDEAFVDTVDLDDLILDVTAKRIDRMLLSGDFYTVPYEVVMDSPIFDRDDKRAIAPDFPRMNQETGEQRLQAAMLDRAAYDSMIAPTVDLMDIYLPVQGELVTMTREEGRVLKVQPWDGPRDGPYRHLYFQAVPGHVMPLAPLQTLIELHLLENLTMRKMARRIDRMKQVMTVRPTAETDADRIADADDGAVITVDSPQDVAEHSISPFDPSQLMFAKYLMESASWAGGNLNLMAGLMPEADTLGQERMLQQGAGGKIAAWQASVVKFARNNLRDLAYYEAENDEAEWVVNKVIDAGLNIGFRGTMRPADHRHYLTHYAIDVDPYSLVDSTPGERLDRVFAFVREVYLPMVELAARQGAELDFRELTRLAARYGNSPEIERVLRFRDPDEQAMAKQAGAAAQSPVTRHESVRVNRGGGNGTGKSQQMMSQAVQPPAQPSPMSVGAG